ncbi:MAG: hypothetical protein B6240_08105 [Desulfobacteraceae bacterium 4572_87]|nr:MAG: hypothetical protein B6240_08105 [Desulfobacteraceae bacterium 4572_87]
MKLPKQLEKEGVAPDVRAALEAERIALYGDSAIDVPVLKLTPKLRTNIFHAKSQGEIVIGYEAIAKALANELRGLKKIDSLGDRVSRLLMVTNDGSPRFYREVAFLQKRQGNKKKSQRSGGESRFAEQKEIRDPCIEEPGVNLGDATFSV